MTCPFCHNQQPCQCGAPGESFSPAKSPRQVHDVQGRPPAIAPAAVLEGDGQMRLRLGAAAYSPDRCGICGGQHLPRNCPKGHDMYDNPPRRGRSAGRSSASPRAQQAGGPADAP